ncbi:hypothetical protein M408DRAFT_313662 [Serendipita vermifera MAFF 305830]|uniref:Ketoreductase domain-containing protein n=1 Tax=Serendipita vermifera MAFF 305830 TaxID=933852 RepID=A0A0C2WIR5_SERVB|nr:hypothetical protein M408DRAFT_313662 [Serendipita vermifera MAFF 305830]
MSPPQSFESTLAFDSLDVDLVITVASHTVFSPFFTFFIPIIYKGVGQAWSEPTVYVSIAWFLLVTLYWFVGFAANKWRNAGTPGRLDWGEQVIVITGGASGIGALLANTLALRHCTVAVLDLKPIETENHNITYYKCDVSDSKQVERVAKEIKEELGEPTVIINNAGIVHGKLILDLSDEDVKQTFNVNVLAQFNILRAFLPSLLTSKRGHIVTVSSLLGRPGAACAQTSDYAASKAALISLHGALREELDFHYNAPLIRTTLLAPGLLQTPMFAGQRPLRENVRFMPGWLFDFLLPTVPANAVVKEIIKALDLQESREIVMPELAKAYALVPLLPYWVTYYIKWVSLGWNWPCAAG